MVDPVILCETGVSYERRNIEEWVEAHGYDESSHGHSSSGLNGASTNYGPL